MNRQVEPWGQDTVRGLSQLDIVKLAYPFQRHEHQFTQGMCYIRETAIANRLDKIDPNWQFIVQREIKNDQSVVVVASLQVKGIARSNTGAGAALMNDKPHVYADQLGNAYKGATTDALKRCARLFGIGRYILTAPKEGAEFDRWLIGKLAEAKKAYADVQVDAIEVVADTVQDD